jgi:mono/diheme cytochrome c family protein
MMVRTLSVLALSAFVAATACGGDDDDSPGTGGSAGAHAGMSGKGGKAGATSGGSSGASEAGATGLGGNGEGGATESPVVARGDYLVNHVAACPDCHTPRNEMGAPIMEKYMSGAECFVKLPTGDCLNSRNLTSDATGLKNYTDEQIKSAIRDGVRPADNDSGAAGAGGAAQSAALSPVMPYYVFHNMTDDDLDAVVAFLRTIPAVEHDVPASAEAFAVPQAAPPLDPSIIPSPDKSFPEYASAMRGRYLASEAGVCIECHTKHTEPGSMDVLELDKLFAGGETFDVGLPVVPVSANLTSDNDTGLGKWTADQIVTALLQGTDDEGKGLCPPMPAGPMGAFGGITKDDALDIANYVKSLPPIVNQIDDMCSLPLGQ